MTRHQRLLCIVYGAFAAWALVGTWGHNMAYLSFGPMGGGPAFIHGTLATAASRSITVDIIVLCLAVWVWMLGEARRLGMRGVWWYILGSVLVAVSVAVPLFLIQRERARASQGEAPARGLTRVDWLGVAVLAVVGLAYTVWSYAAAGSLASVVNAS